MSSLGIYFGPKMISLVEVKGKKLLKHIQIPRLRMASFNLEEKIPEEVKTVALLKDELRKNKIEAKEGSICLSGKDLIIRTFEMPYLPATELKSAINFEVKKYIPFKVEDLISDFQLRFDKPNQRNLIIFIGIKKETLDIYLSILGQLDIEALTIEYSGFSVLRFLKLAHLSRKGVVGVINVDLEEESEVSFVVLEEGFCLFSRDATLSAGPEEAALSKEVDRSAALEKLKTEIRISLDYYRRKFPTKNIQKIILISSKDSFLELEAYLKETGMLAQFVDATRFIDRPVPFYASFVKSYSVSLSRIIKTSLKIDLLSARAKLRLLAERPERPEVISLLKGIRIGPRIIILALFICLIPFFFGLYKRLPLEKELKNIIALRPKISTVNTEAGYQEFLAIKAQNEDKLSILDNLTRKQVFVTAPLDAIPRVIPKGLWLRELAFNKQEEKTELTLRGSAYLADSDKELELVNTFISNLRNNPDFNQYFKQINIVSIEQSKTEKITVTNFTITCRKD